MTDTPVSHTPFIDAKAPDAAFVPIFLVIDYFCCLP
jgi:hypothetical protein